MHGFRVLVQSERDAEYVESRIEAWLQSFRQLIVDMSDDDFITQRTSLINRKLEDHKNMNSECVHSVFTDWLSFALTSSQDACLLDAHPLWILRLPATCVAHSM